MGLQQILTGQRRPPRGLVEETAGYHYGGAVVHSDERMWCLYLAHETSHLSLNLLEYLCTTLLDISVIHEVPRGGVGWWYLVLMRGLLCRAQKQQRVCFEGLITFPVHTYPISQRALASHP